MYNILFFVYLRVATFINGYISQNYSICSISRVLLACVCFWIHIDWFLTTWQKMKNIFISFAFKDFFHKHSFHFLTMKIFPALRCNNGRNIFSHFFPLLWPVGVLLLDLEGWGLKQYVSWSWNYSNIMR